ncbi:phosphate regulon sensor histidine kinase PhoR [Solemya pervernicosa gill symbiont]|uniref:Phosphate regulon sensor protein PhoR n=2 Tax=Gammaproteobacteria incertae sedis TaxID=118884 RepID=A0A1T2L3N8_9GAMM|nr:phosphate regulon sensor histidine kinase PhoR [Candidatus Reidiella endopervernicosa]OOZ39694.1 phosphate regulon sensor histidine kinase PhoR [Solemya pervernicosa gill symbiont]QKQ24972.1 phosphate regulon sensor histidine kinase PhoR [Candidatus Reidiella endopervernicosa]
MANRWAEEIWRLVAVIVVMLLLGLLTGETLMLLLLTVSGYLVWHLRHLYQLERWFRQGGSSEPPEGDGIWGELFNDLHRMRQRDRRNRRKMKKLFKRFQETTAAMPDAMVITAEQGEIEWFNAAAKRLLGLHKRDAGQRIDNLVRYPYFTHYMASGNYSETLQMASPVDASKTLRIRVVPYAKNQRLLVVRDVTRIQHLEQMRRDFVANMSHELRTPLTVINGYLEALEDNEVCMAEMERPINRMREQSSRMQLIVNDLLFLSRLENEPESATQQAVDVAQMLEGIKDEAEAMSGGQHTINLHADPTVTLQGDLGELRSAFTNLVINAVKYTPEGGKIEIEWFGDHEGAHFEIKDDGVGIPREYISRLTERFYRVDMGRSRDSGGTGLGLAIVKHVLNRHAADLHIESTFGKGSRFNCDFPLERISLSESS